MASAGAARVLEILGESPGTAHSGELLSEQLGVSRAQIWKHVERLRGRGYTIEGERGGGYLLTGRPDRPGRARHPMDRARDPLLRHDGFHQPHRIRSGAGGRGPRNGGRSRRTDRRTRPPRAFLLLAPVPESLHVDRVATRTRHRPSADLDSQRCDRGGRSHRTNRARPGGCRDQVAQRRAIGRAQDFGNLDGDERGSDPGG
ncbi:MAG: HTH domain-containing protein, partial [Deltaproteobacteria bacterium]|nr:HTH domain-containing protein [Deltaproteobacteria bacterium]